MSANNRISSSSWSWMKLQLPPSQLRFRILYTRLWVVVLCWWYVTLKKECQRSDLRQFVWGPERAVSDGDDSYFLGEWFSGGFLILDCLRIEDWRLKGLKCGCDLQDWPFHDLIRYYLRNGTILPLQLRGIQNLGEGLRIEWPGNCFGKRLLGKRRNLDTISR